MLQYEVKKLPVRNFVKKRPVKSASGKRVRVSCEDSQVQVRYDLMFKKNKICLKKLDLK